MNFIHHSRYEFLSHSSNTSSTNVVRSSNGSNRPGTQISSGQPVTSSRNNAQSPRHHIGNRVNSRSRTSSETDGDNGNLAGTLLNAVFSELLQENPSVVGSASRRTGTSQTAASSA